MSWEAILKSRVLMAGQRRKIIEYMERQNYRPMSAVQIFDAVKSEFRTFPAPIKLDNILRKDSESPNGDFEISYDDSMRKPNGDLIRLYSVREKNE